MADGGIQINTNTVNVTADLGPVKRASAGETRFKQEAVEAEKKQSEKALENVISVSEDGDTVQATDESMERLEEDAFGRVVVEREGDENARTVNTEENITTAQSERNTSVEKNAEAEDDTTVNPTQERLEEANDPNRIDPTKERLEEAEDPNRPDPAKERIEAEIKRQERAEERENFNLEKEEQETNEAQITSFKGYTDQQLEQLYIKGEISRNDYEQEMDSRQERAEAVQEGNREFNREMAEDISEQESVQRQGQELETVYSPDSSDTLSARTRDDILTGLQNFSLNN